jgi:hypothetical protein
MHTRGKPNKYKGNSAVQRSDSITTGSAFWRKAKMRLTCCAYSVLCSVYSGHPNVVQHIYSVLLLTLGYGISNSCYHSLSSLTTYAPSQKECGGPTKSYCCYLANRECHLARISEPLRRKDNKRVRTRHSGTSHQATAYSLTFPPSGPGLHARYALIAGAWDESIPNQKSNWKYPIAAVYLLTRHTVQCPQRSAIKH